MTELGGHRFVAYPSDMHVLWCNDLGGSGMRLSLGLNDPGVKKLG